MKVTKKEQNALIIIFWFQFIVLIVIIYFLFSFFIPQVKQINNEKTEVVSLYDEFNKVNKQWLSFEDFIFLNKNTDSTDKYFTNLLSVLEKDFYNSNMTNTWEISYEEFLEDKQSFITDNIGSDQNDLVWTILPSYIENTDSDNARSFWFRDNW